MRRNKVKLRFLVPAIALAAAVGWLAVGQRSTPAATKPAALAPRVILDPQLVDLPDQCTPSPTENCANVNSSTGAASSAGSGNNTIWTRIVTLTNSGTASATAPPNFSVGTYACSRTGNDTIAAPPAVNTKTYSCTVTVKNQPTAVSGSVTVVSNGTLPPGNNQNIVVPVTV